MALGRLRERPGFVVAVATLAFGMGLNILFFSFTSPVLLKALPYPEPDRLLDVSMAPPDNPDARGPITPPLYGLLRDRTSAAFDAIGVFDAGSTANLAGDAQGPAERLAVHRISAAGLAALGPTPLYGRLPVAADEALDARPTMLLSYDVWQRRFGGRADIVNHTVQVDGQPTLVLGVMPEGFGLLDYSSDAWFTSSFAAETSAQETQHSLRAVGRLKASTSMDQARAAVTLALDEYARTFPDRDSGWTVELTPWRDARFGGLVRPLTLVQLGVGVMLLLLCVNLAVLLAARSGAGLVDTVLLSTGSVVVGGVLAALTLPGLRALAPRVLPRLDEVAFDGSGLAFALLLCVATTVVVGVIVTWRSLWRSWLGATLAAILVAVEMTLAFLVSAGAGFAGRAVADLQGRDVGVNPAHLLSLDVHLPRNPYVTPDVAQAGSAALSEYHAAGPVLYDRIRAALQTTPGVVQAAGMGTQPFASAPFVQYWIGESEHQPGQQVAAQYLPVTDNYFNTMGIRIVRGRDFTASDQPTSSWVVLVNETLATQNWPGGDALGQRITLTFHPGDEEPSREIVGVVTDTLPFRSASEVRPLIYVLHRQQAARQRASFEGRRTVMSFVVRTTGDPLALEDAVRAAVGTVDMTTPVTAVRTLESYLNAGQTLLLTFTAMLLGISAVVAVVTGVVGVYGFAELGIALRGPVVAIVVGALAAVATGLAVGLAVWQRIGRVIEPYLTNLTVTPSDPLILGSIGGVLLALTLAACLVPALRTVKIGR